MKAKQPSKPVVRNWVAKNAKVSGAGRDVQPEDRRQPKHPLMFWKMENQK